MICKVCLGKGWILNENYTERIECPACHGTKETEPTNEDWLCSLSTVEKAIWLSKVAEKLKGNVWMWENWLKEVHRGSK